MVGAGARRDFLLHAGIHLFDVFPSGNISQYIEDGFSAVGYDIVHQSIMHSCSQ
jgi:hypothetical protein